jgi:hypothetical protein
MIYVILTYGQAVVLLAIGTVYLFKRINRQSVIRLSGEEAKAMARECLEEITNYEYSKGALKRFFEDHVDTGRLKLYAFDTVQRKLRDSHDTDPRLIKTIIQYCRPSVRVEIKG